MNERIQELMIEAGKTIPGDKHIDADFCNKFAKLIISECMDVLDPGENQVIARFQARQWLAEHFGDE